MGGRRSLPHVGQEGQRKEGRGRGRRRGSEMRKKGNGEKSKGRDGERGGDSGTRYILQGHGPSDRLPLTRPHLRIIPSLSSIGIKLGSSTRLIHCLDQILQ